MKSVVTDAATRVLCLRLLPVTGAPIYLTDHPRDLTMSGHTYLSTSGYEFTGYSATAGFAPGSLDLQGISGVAGISRAQIAAGLFDGAVVSVFATSWAAPVEDEEPIVRGLFGKARLEDDRYVIDGLSLIDALNTARNDQFTAQCPKVFLSQGFGVPKSWTTKAVGMPSKSPCATPTPVSMKRGSTMFARCPGLAIQPRSASSASSKWTARFSPPKSGR
jgi:hypothetical protein